MNRNLDVEKEVSVNVRGSLVESGELREEMQGGRDEVLERVLGQRERHRERPVFVRAGVVVTGGAKNKAIGLTGTGARRDDSFGGTTFVEWIQMTEAAKDALSQPAEWWEDDSNFVETEQDEEGVYEPVEGEA